MKKYVLFIMLSWACQVYAQTPEGEMVFLPTLQQASVELGKSYFLPTLQDSVRIENLKFYVSNLAFFKDGKMVKALPTKHILMDLESLQSLRVLFSMKKTFDEIRFHIGIDSLTNTAGALSGDLDPTKGMYWTWQSGYINFKLEGISKACPTRNHIFQYHIGGYQTPFNTLQKVSLKVGRQDKITIEIALDKFFEQIDVRKTSEIMSPNAQAVALSKLLSAMFLIRK